MRLFWVYARQMPHLHARESIHRINELSFAFGAMRKEDSERFIADLQELAVGRPAHEPIEEHPVRAASIEQMHRMLGQSGVTVA